MNLVIVESPAKTKTIAAYLGVGYTVISSVGHIRDLPKSNRKAIDIEGGFIPHYEVIKGKEKVAGDIEKAAHGAERVLLATDPDREGEAIAWHIAHIIGVGNSESQIRNDEQSTHSKVHIPKIQRIVFHEITKPAIEAALKHPREIDMNLVSAQQARRVLDRLVGYDLSGLIWKKVRYGLSAGRVQSPALRIIVEREREIRAFTPETYWVITGTFTTDGGDTLTLTCTKEPRDKKGVTDILTRAKKEPWRITDVNAKETKRSPYAPFTTPTLQQAASARLGFTPARTMQRAQKLYEKGHITYMRTDSTTIAKTAVSDIAHVVSETFGKEYLHVRAYKTKSKAAQEAHEAIRPTRIAEAVAGSTPDEKKLYTLIRTRTLAAHMSDANVLKTRITANTEGGTVPDFTVTGSHVLFDGWLAADTTSRGKELEVPKVARDEKLRLESIESGEKETSPPPRYTEAGLVKELEKRGIGRPSTYAPIVKTIQDRAYVEKVGRTLRPTDVGEVVTEFLEKNFGTIVSDSFTAHMEDDLDAIANGKKEYKHTLAAFYGPFSKEVREKARSAEKITTLGKADPEMRCPACGGSMVIKLGRSGKFLSCARFPDCSGARTIDGAALDPPKETGEVCPECTEGKLIERDGRYGTFVACNRYPKCRYIKKDNKNDSNHTDVTCPKCEKGVLAERRGRYGVFYGCSTYPECDLAMKARPTGNTCPTCGSLMMEGTKTIPERCSSKECSNHNPHKAGKSEPQQT